MRESNEALESAKEALARARDSADRYKLEAETNAAAKKQVGSPPPLPLLQKDGHASQGHNVLGALAGVGCLVYHGCGR